MTPDPRIVRRLKKIDRDLSVEWITPPGRFGVFHGLQIAGRYDETVSFVAAELQAAAAKQGYLWSHDECCMKARDAVHAGKLVCYVTEDDGSYRPLDNRLLQKFERMDFWRRNIGLKDWREMLKAKADIAREQLQRAKDDIWDSIRRDKVLAEQVSDILWGVRPVRSVCVPTNYEVNRVQAPLSHP